MNINLTNTYNECSVDFEERMFSLASSICNIIIEFIHKEDCETVEEAEILATILQDMASDMTQTYINTYYTQVEAVKEENRVYELAVEIFNDWLENSEYPDMLSFENQYKRARALEIDVGIMPDKIFLYLCSDTFIGDILTEFDYSVIKDEKTLERVCTEAYMIGLVIGDIIFEDESQNPIRKLSRINPVDGGLSQLVKEKFKEGDKNE